MSASEAAAARVKRRCDELAWLLHDQNHRNIDRMFVVLMVLQWMAGVFTALAISPRTWIGEHSLVHVHVVAAVVLGGAISLAPILLGVFHPGRVVTRHTVAVSQALWGALLIHLSGGRIETHFHVFGSLAFIAFYRDWRVLLTMSVVVAVDHAVRGIFFPLSVYGIVTESPYRWVEHAGWVVFEDVVLFLACYRGQNEARAVCQHQAKLEETNARIEDRVRERSSQLSDAKNFFQSVLDSINAHICVLDRFGCIVDTNAFWDRFSVQNGGADRLGVGANYLDVCRDVTGECREDSLRIADAIESVIRAELTQHTSEYACHSEDAQRWFQVNVTPLLNHERGAVVVAHSDITDRVIAQRQVQESAEHLELLSLVAEYTDNSVVITDAQGRIEWVNRGFERLTGYKFSEVCGLKPGSFLEGEATSSETVEFMHERLAENEGFDVEIVKYRKDGSSFWVDVEVRPIKLESGEVTRFIAIESDITEEREREQSLRLLRSAVDHAGDAMFVIDAESRLVDVNATACQRLGYEREQMLKMKLSDIEVGFSTLTWSQKWTELNKESIQLFETELRTSDGQQYPVEVTPMSVQQGGRKYVCAFARDITARRLVESEKRSLAVELQLAARQAGMAEVATGVLHNVGNVLNSVNVSANLLRECVAGTPVAQLTKAAEIIAEQGESVGEFLTNDNRGKHFPRVLSQLACTFEAKQAAQFEEIKSLASNIDHIKQIVSMQQSLAKRSGQTELIEPSKLFEEAIKMDDASLLRHGVDIRCCFKEVAPITSKRHEVLQILVNLIRNAKQAVDATFSNEKWIELVIDQDDEFIVFMVVDNGIGISADNLKRIFQHGFTTKKTGHGFGLHSCANFAQEMGGSMAVQSEGTGRGATFILRLPKDAAVSNSETLQVQSAPSQG